MLQQFASAIDRHIHSQYKLRPNNFAAYDLLYGNEKYINNYTVEDKAAFLKLIEQAQAEIEGGKEEIKERFLKMYANPVINANA